MSDFPETNHSLIARIKDLGDGTAWSEFLAIYRPVVMRMARRRGLQDADSNDVLQQVFVSISRSISRWEASDERPPFRAWLATIARNAITKSLTRRPKDVASGSTSVRDLLHEQPDAVSTEAEIDAEARKELLRWASKEIRGEFGKGTWEVFWRTAIKGDSVSEVAKSTGRTAGSIYVARYRVTARLKEKVQKSSQQWNLSAE